MPKNGRFSHYKRRWFLSFPGDVPRAEKIKMLEEGIDSGSDFYPPNPKRARGFRRYFVHHANRRLRHRTREKDNG